MRHTITLKFNGNRPFNKTYGFLNENSVGSSTKMTTSQKLIIILSKLIKTL